MKSTSTTEQRESRKWWAVTEHFTVQKVTGYSCAPNSPTMWWVPEIGSSMSENHHLFETQVQALAAAVRQVKLKIDGFTKIHADLSQQIHEHHRTAKS